MPLQEEIMCIKIKFPLIKAIMTNLVLFNGLKNAIKKIYKKYKKLIIKKMRKWFKNSKIFKKIIMKIGYWGSHGD